MNTLTGPINRLLRPSLRRTGRCASGVAAGWRRARLPTSLALERRAVFPPAIRAQATALACSLPQTQGLPLSRWSSAEIAQRLQQSHAVPAISASTIRRWLTTERLRPWRSHTWQHIHDPVQFLARARPVLESYAQAQHLLEAGTWLVCLDEKTSIQARAAERPPEPASAGHPLRQSPRYQRQGALHLFAGLSVADGQICGRCASRKRFVDFQAFLREVILPAARARHVHTVRLILDNGSTHAPKRFVSWLVAEAAIGAQPIAIEVCWLPPNASWLDQLEIWFSLLQRKLLQPNHFPHLEGLSQRLGAFITTHNRTAKPIKWSYTVDRLQQKLGIH